jgi:glycosyltransferase involved in cell wall biosynthesis
MRAKTIIFVIDGLDGGGAGKVVLTLAEEMAEQGHETYIFSLSDNLQYPIPHGVRYVLVQAESGGLFHRLTAVKRLARALDCAVDKIFAGRKIDLVLSNLINTDRIVSRCRTLPNVWYCLHNSLVYEYLGGPAKVKNFRRLFRLQSLYRNKKIITVSDGIQDDIHHCGIEPSDLVTIHNPFPVDRIRELARKNDVPLYSPFILHVGRFHAQKRHDRLVEAFALSHYNGRLVLLGEGEEEQKQRVIDYALELGVADRIYMLGFSANPFSYMKKADALVLSSDYEGFGNCIIEAQICGTPVVSTDCPYGPKEILVNDTQQGLSGLDAVDLADKLDRVLVNRPLLDESAIRRFDVKHIVAKYLALAA